MTDEKNSADAASAQVIALPRLGRHPLPTLVGRVTHTVYPVKYMVAVGGLTTGFAFYGPFDTDERAATWARHNINFKHSTSYQVYPMFDVRDDR